jgi:hypothetical protein
MAHFAKLDSDNRVIDVIVVNNSDIGDLEFPDSEPLGIEFLHSNGFDGEFKQTSYNHNFRKRYAAIDYTYDPDRDEFVPYGWVLVDGEWTNPQPLDLENQV